jgi:hypothetical protein
VKKIILLIACILSCIVLIAQSKQKSQTHFSVNGGVGLIHYLNTLQIDANLVNQNHIGFSFRVLWEPEHRLSLGLETGYYPFYQISKAPTKKNPLTGESGLTVIPILLHLRMRVVNNFYLTAGTGAAILQSETTALGSTATSSELSLSDFQGSVLYLRPINRKMSWGGELKFLNIGKTEDFALSLQAIVAYKF